MKKGTYKPIKLRLVDKKEFDLNDLNKIMSTENLFYVVNPSEEIFRLAYAEIKSCGADFHKFIALYEKACQELGIKERNMVIWNGLLDKLIAKTLAFYDKFTEKKKKEFYERAESAIKAIQRGDKL